MKLTVGGFMNKFRFKSNGDGTCQLVVDESFAETVLHVPEKSPDDDKVISVIVAGVLFNKDMTTLIRVCSHY